MARTATSKTTEQIDLFAWADDLEAERERIAEINEERAARRGYLVLSAMIPRSPPTIRLPRGLCDGGVDAEPGDEQGARSQRVAGFGRIWLLGATARS